VYDHDYRRAVITVVGIGADGWAGLAEPARGAVLDADVLFGSARQLSLLPQTVAEKVVWPSPLLPALRGLMEAHADRRACVLASGDPMFFGIGTALIQFFGPDRVRILPQASSASLACARMGWPLDETDVVSVVGRPIEGVCILVQPGRRFLVLSADGRSPEAVAELLIAKGYGASRLTVFERLGHPAERRVAATAATWRHKTVDPLNVIAVECLGEPVLSHIPGLPDDAYEHDGQLTKREIRAVTLARLAPVPGQLLWDVGAGSGSIGIEWMRSHRTCRAVAVEHRPDRLGRIAANAAALGVPGLSTVAGHAPAALAGLEAPDAIFIGGGLTTSGVVDVCWSALRPGGRLVANAVTLETETALAGWYDRLGGDLTRLAVSRAEPVGGFTGWRPALPVTQWTVIKA
jgi:precorrin-6Y C5,15-methyltransferase (decarboxylating)